MATYAIGDVQGCYAALQRLLAEIQFDAKNDRLWFAGDLVNRGSDSLKVLRFVKSLSDSAITVLGNHDLHLLAAMEKPFSENRKKALNQVLTAPDKVELVEWLRHRPLFHSDGHFCLVHAGLPPQWDLEEAKARSQEVEQVLRGHHYQILLKAMYGNKPDCWSPDLGGMERLRFAINCFTRIRYCNQEGRLDLDQNGSPGSQPKHLMPWFQVPGRKSANLNIVFGHWSSLGYYEGDNVYGIDTGCVWGGELSALRLGDKVVRFSVDCSGPKALQQEKTVPS